MSYNPKHMYYSTPHFFKCILWITGLKMIWINSNIHLNQTFDANIFRYSFVTNIWYKYIVIFIQFHIYHTLFWLSECFWYISQTAKPHSARKWKFYHWVTPVWVQQLSTLQNTDKRHENMRHKSVSLYFPRYL